MKRVPEIKFIEEAKLKSHLLKIIYTVLLACILYNIIYVINTSITKKEYFSLFGTSFFTINTNAMKPDLRKNDFLIVKEVEEGKLYIDDIIAYEINGNIRINKIINIKNDNGKILYTTKTNQNYYPDIELITQGQIIGKIVCNIPFVGFISNILETKIAAIIIILILLLRFLYNKYAYQKSIHRRRKKAKYIN